jgi:hypothetical protein
MQAMSSRLWLFGLALSTATFAGAGEPVSIRVNPAIAVAPTTLAISVNVSPQPQNRALEIVVDSSDFYRLSRVQLEGDRAPVVNTMKIDSVPAGEYEVTATVIGADGVAASMARAYVEVMGTSPALSAPRVSRLRHSSTDQARGTSTGMHSVRTRTQGPS